MSQTGITIVAIFLAAILMFIFPLMTMADRKDETTDLEVKIATKEFTDEIRATGKITQDKYDNFVLRLASSGNSYDIEMTIQRKDTNSAKKESTITIGDNVYYTEYTTQIFDEMKKDTVVTLKEGDIISVEVKNTNLTIGDLLKKWMYNITGNKTDANAASESGFVTANG